MTTPTTRGRSSRSGRGIGPMACIGIAITIIFGVPLLVGILKAGF